MARAAAGAGPVGGWQAGGGHGQQYRECRLIWPAQRCRERPTKSPASGRAGRISCLSRYSSRRLVWMLFEDVVYLLFQFKFLFFQILHLGAVVAGVVFLQLSDLRIQVVVQVKLLLEMDITALQFRDEISVLRKHVMKPPCCRLIVPARPKYPLLPGRNVIPIQFGATDLLHGKGDL